MKKRNRLAVLIPLLFNTPVMALCVLDKVPPLGGVDPMTLSSPALTIYIDADQKASTTTPIDVVSTPTSHLISYLCIKDQDIYGKNVLPPLTSAGAAGMFTTLIDGIAIKPLFGNNKGMGTFNSERTVSQARMNFSTASFYKAEFYKTRDRLDLQNPDGDIVMNSGPIAFNWMNIANQDNAALTFNLGEIHIISTPVCRLDGTRTVDFNNVNSSQLRAGVSRPLNFSLVCATDYGSYTAKAALTTQTATSDNKFIKVFDSLDNPDVMKIEVRDSKGKSLPLDGLTGEVQQNVTSEVPADFNWTAILSAASDTELPQNGKFRAQAEIVLDLN